VNQSMLDAMRVTEQQMQEKVAQEAEQEAPPLVSQSHLSDQELKERLDKIAQSK